MTIAAALPAGAEAATKNFYGIVPFGYPTPTAEELQRIARGGVQSIRLHVNWASIEPMPGSRNWEPFDDVVADASQAGLVVVPTFYGTPSWASADPRRAPIYSPEQRAGWQSFVREAAARYGRQGSFWALNPHIPPRPFSIWQVWNEVNLRYYWGARPNARRYLDLVRLTKDALRDSDPLADVLLAGLIPFKSIGAGSTSGDRYLEHLYKFRRARALIDAVDVHPYGSNPGIVVKAVRETRKTLNSVGARRTPLWVTEFGWSTGGSDWHRSPLRASLRQQAKWVTSTYKLLRKSRKRLRLRRAFYLSLADNPGDPSWIGHMGLFHASGDPKPAWYAYVRQAGGVP